MNIEELSKQINALNKPELDSVFQGDVMAPAEYLGIITRVKQRHALRDLYLQRAILYVNNKEYEKACFDYFHSAQLGHPASKIMFSEFEAQHLQYLVNNVEIPNDLSAETAFMAFLQHSTGIGKPINHVKALFNLKCSAQLGHPHTKALCTKETISMIHHCLMQSNKNGTVLVSLTLDNANASIGKYFLANNFQGKALSFFEASAKMGSGYGYEGLGCLYFDNIAYPADYYKSLRLYAVAAEAGNTGRLRADSYLALNYIAHDDPDETIHLLNDLAQSRVVGFVDFADALTQMIKKRSFSFWADNIELTRELKNKIHEVLALCEITQNPCNPYAGLKHMELISDFSQCSKATCDKLVSFHRNFSGRNVINKSLLDLLSPFAAVANGEEVKVLTGKNKTMQALS